MNEKKKDAIFIPLRGGSKGIIGKNLLPLQGQPLFYYALDAVIGLLGVDIWISTDSKAIASLARGYDKRIHIFERSEASATDIASSEYALLEFAEVYKDYRHYILVQGTNPFIRQGDIEAGLLAMEKGYDSVVSVVETGEFFWMNIDKALPINYHPQQRPRRQDRENNIIYAENGSFYITKQGALLESQCRISGHIGLVTMPPISRLEIDNMADFHMANFLIQDRMVDEKNAIYQRYDMDRVVTENISMIRPAKEESRQEWGEHRNIQNPFNIKGVFTDCDGVLTDGGMYYGTDRMEYKKFHARDGHGFELLREQGIFTGIISGEANKILENRANKLQVSTLLMGISDKVAAMIPVLEARQIDFSDIAYIGDDVHDIALMKKVKISFAPYNAHKEAKRAADIVLEASGGAGAFREMVDFLLGHI